MPSNLPLSSKDQLTTLAKSYGITSWNELTEFVRNLPYGRNKNRTDFGLVLSEQKGSCSSKHAFLKSMADLNKIPNINLVLGIYRMNISNTPKIGTVLIKNAIEYIPEAHCYLKINGIRTDYTTKKSEFKNIEKDIIQEIDIQPKQVIDFKVTYHKVFIKNWMKSTNSKFDFDQIWHIREKCIENLSS